MQFYENDQIIVSIASPTSLYVINKSDKKRNIFTLRDLYCYSPVKDCAKEIIQAFFKARQKYFLCENTNVHFYFIDPATENICKIVVSSNGVNSVAEVTIHTLYMQRFISGMRVHDLIPFINVVFPNNAESVYDWLIENGYYNGKCDKCGEKITHDNFAGYHGKIYCFDCIEKFEKCPACAVLVPKGTVKPIVYMYQDNEFTAHVCTKCAKIRFHKCDKCGQMKRSAEFSVSDRDGELFICTACQKNSPKCIMCGKVSNSLICSSCEDKIIFKQYCRTKTLFFVDRAGTFSANPTLNEIYFGFEIEAEFNSHKVEKEKSISAKTIYDTYSKKGKLFDIKRDGSIENGFEFAFAPITYRAFTSKTYQKIFNDFFSYLIGINMGINQHCGGHIHFSKIPKTRAAMIDYILFSDANYNEMKKFSRRTGGFNYCDNYLKNDKTPESKLAKATQMVNNNLGRGFVLNCSPPSTYETRIFSGTLNYDILLARVQFLLIIINNPVRSCTFTDIFNMAQKAKYDNLCKELIETGVVNDVK